MPDPGAALPLEMTPHVTLEIPSLNHLTGPSCDPKMVPSPVISSPLTSVTTSLPTTLLNAS